MILHNISNLLQYLNMYAYLELINMCFFLKLVSHSFRNFSDVYYNVENILKGDNSNNRDTQMQKGGNTWESWEPDINWGVEMVKGLGRQDAGDMCHCVT